MIDYDSALSPRIKGVAPSGIRKFFDLLENMNTDDAISLGVGEPDFDTPWHIRDAGVHALEKGFTKYTSNAGLADLRREIAKYLDRRFSLRYDPMKQMIPKSRKKYPNLSRSPGASLVFGFMGLFSGSFLWSPPYTHLHIG